MYQLKLQYKWVKENDWRKRKMTGTALVLVNKEDFIVLENVDKQVYKELHEHTGEEVVHFGKISSILWSEEDIDWEYGY
jgi:hypothetical protein